MPKVDCLLRMTFMVAGSGVKGMLDFTPEQGAGRGAAATALPLACLEACKGKVAETRFRGWHLINMSKRWASEDEVELWQAPNLA